MSSVGYVEPAPRLERDDSSGGLKGVGRLATDRGGLKDLAALVASVIGVVTALAGGATVGGGFDRMSRNYSWQMGSALFFLTVAAVLGAVPVFRGALGMEANGFPKSWDNWALFGAVLAFVIGLGFSFWTMLASAGNRSVPSVSITQNVDSSGVTLYGADIRSSGLGAREYVRVKVFRVARRQIQEPLYVGKQGPDSSGDVRVSAAFPLPPGPYDAVLVKVWQSDNEPDCVPDEIPSEDIFVCVTTNVLRK